MDLTAKTPRFPTSGRHGAQAQRSHGPRQPLRERGQVYRPGDLWTPRRAYAERGIHG